MKGGDVSRDEKKMRVERFLRAVVERAKAVFTHKSKGFNDMVYIATAIVSTVVVAVIGVYISAQIYDVTQLSSTSPFNTAMNSAIQIMNATYPLLIVVAIGIIAGIILTYLMGGFGVAGGGREEGRGEVALLHHLLPTTSPPLSCQH